MSLAAFPLSFAWGGLCYLVDKHFRKRYIRTGRIAINSTRKNGHFPVILLWIPYVYIDCFLAGVFGHSSTSEAGSVDRHEVMQMAAIGGSFVAIVWVLLSPVVVGILQDVYQTLKEIANGVPEQDDPSILPYLYRQAEALVWLLTPTPQKKSPPPETAPASV